MNLEQYVGCLLMYNGRIAVITGARSNYDGDVFRIRYIDGEACFDVSAFDDELTDELPDPACGILKRGDNDVVFLFNETEYTLGSHPYEPCLYIKKDGEIIRTLHNAFDAYELPEKFARKETLSGIDGKEYDEQSFLRVLVTALACKRAEMDFTYAAVLAGTETERYEDYKTDRIPDGLIKVDAQKVNSTPKNFCPFCGRKNQGSKFCPECGTKLI